MHIETGLPLTWIKSQHTPLVVVLRVVGMILFHLNVDYNDPFYHIASNAILLSFDADRARNDTNAINEIKSIILHMNQRLDAFEASHSSPLS